MLPGVTIVKGFRFEAAHKLPHHDGKCANLHGHSYKVEVELHGPVQPPLGQPDEGMVCDFARIKDAWQPLFAQLDHVYLNGILDPVPTTAENLAVWILSQLTPTLAGRGLRAVRVWETQDAYAEARRDA